jgi:type IX secretion system PorP/SprF family membrane protein
VPFLLNAQSNVRLNNYWDNTYYVNPSAINEDYKALFSLAARKQWLGFPGAPSTFFVTAATYSSKMRTQYGLKIYADQIGYDNITNISLSYAYSISLNRDWELNLGLAGSFQCLSYDKSQVSTMSSDDPALYENLLQDYNYNCDAGAELINKSWRIGASGQNLLSIFYKENRLQENSNYLYAMYRKRTNNPIGIQFGLSVIQNNQIEQVEGSLTSFFKMNEDPDALHVGLFFRTLNEMGVIVGCNLNESIHLAYSYDFNVSGISRYSVGTHELMLVYKLGKYPYRGYRY